MIFNKKEFIELCINNVEYEKNLGKVTESKEENKGCITTEDIFKLKENKNKKEREYKKFIHDTKKSLLAECIYSLMDKSIGYQQDKVRADVIKRNLVDNFIQEQGVDSLISRFRTESALLSEYSRIVEKYSKIIVEKVDKDNPDTFLVEPEEKDKFFEELEMSDVDEIATAIKMRVSDSVDEFINSNIRQKEEIKEVLTKSKEKIESSRSEEIKESYNILAKRKISSIREGRKMNIFESMVFTLAEASMKDEQLKSIYTVNGKLDMDSIVENCTIMYSFLETLNSAKMVKIDEAYLKDVLEQLKK